MPTQVINPDSTFYLHDKAPKRGRIRFVVETSHPLPMELMSALNYARRKRGEEYKSEIYVATTDRWEQEVEFPPTQEWYLLVYNKTDSPVGVHFEVFA